VHEPRSSHIAKPAGDDCPSGWLGSRFDPILIILSPPRCGSTALARAFSQHPAFGWYVHEPYDRVYHRKESRETVRAALSQPLSVGSAAGGVVIKEMTFQAREHFLELLDTATLPLVVCLRDPRQAVLSRMEQRQKAGQEPMFPLVESGWFDLQQSLDVAGRNGIPYVLVDITALRERPATLLPMLCQRLGLEYFPAMLSWPSREDVVLGQLGDEQRHWYQRVLASTEFAPPTEEIPSLDAFPVAGGLRDHVADLLRIYRQLLQDDHALPRTGGR
jgi:hypothetical protein